ncbi:MAG: peptidase domain-containing ABC transporter [Tildeniella nuda ZEHNDER 1965/U140]|jgi:ATP-binding cassette subfamily B protein|nr:peptidase domain-containing ABC transporter [Tildeniella nuda ZEHNDER 1965/U140]
MTYTIATCQLTEFLAALPPFDQLSANSFDTLLKQAKPLRYRMGQLIITREKMPAQVAILYDGQVRSLGYESDVPLPVTLERLQPGAIIGWAGLVRGVACETAIASTETICLTLAASDFLQLLQTEPAIASHFHTQPALIELFDLLNTYFQHRADRRLILEAAGTSNLKDFAQTLLPHAMVYRKRASPDYVWLNSSPSNRFAVGDRIQTADLDHAADRLIGLPVHLLLPPSHVNHGTLNGNGLSNVNQTLPFIGDSDLPDIPYASAELMDREEPLPSAPSHYAYVRGSGTVNAVLACFQMLSQHWGFPFRREVVQRILAEQHQRIGILSLRHCGSVAELSGLRSQLVNVPSTAVHRLPTPAIVRWHDSFAVLYDISAKQAILGVPEAGILRRQPDELMLNQPAHDQTEPAETLEVLLLQPTQDTPKQTFGLGWFLPSLYKYRRVLMEVFVASFFVQLFGLANPLITQVIIDKVLVQNSPDTLQILGIFLIVLALFEAVLTSLRTYLFADTTNRIDLALGGEIIDHLLRLPLRYFERRPVGELATRVGELENIRQFLTGTALTVVLDAVFSVLYIVVMFLYSWLLALVALATLPLFAALTALTSPIVRRQLRTKAERNAETQSLLVEVLSGIQTVKAQNLELRSRWQWQERYAKYVSASFKTVRTFTAASATSTFLNQLSGLLVLWVGALLVLQGKLSLGQLIAFRIIAGYVTSPLLRLTQLWQNFQETALSLERLSDILDSPMEADAIDLQNIPMPTIEGTVQYEHVSFRFNPTGAMQLINIQLEFLAGTFVGIVGQSGSGKSTLMKLLPRLYPLESGRILIDGYDINKVELYSLRRQIGIVPQDTLLFEGTIQENMTMHHPNATAEEMIAAAKTAVAHEFIMALPQGYNTNVGERGTALSGGQRQRLAIARTLLQKPRLLILDEATSALDYDTERQVCLNLAEAFKGCTVFFITHRLTTIRNADRILLMDHGTVVEEGTHAALMSLRGRYYCLYQQQDSQL